MSWAAQGLDSIRTARLIGERLRPEHDDTLYVFHRDERVMATLGGVWTAERAATALAEHLRHWDEHGFGFWLLRDAKSGAFVGRGGLRRVEVGGRREVEIAYAIAADRWGRGLATELARACVLVAFERLGLASVVSFTTPTNIASQRVMQKAGLTYERDVVHASLPHVLYRLTSNEWRDGKRAE